MRRYEAETDEIVARNESVRKEVEAGIRDRDERRNDDRLVRRVLLALFVVGAILLFVTGRSYYLPPALIAAALFGLNWRGSKGKE